ncbi:DASH family cryptochrome [Robiginitalea sp. M366]|uniref:DASH family cryptochrome n=1 Tax=Robiginitalea aestuariiviva TaxID=3036903 RepID=UPI00240DBCF2|nr:DASH family cryptochrome [Robiginitalea aestuariiviva]MDG1570771.1 DASH family cryptochrome [Robiginitalea aestuariiviva]
MSTSLYWFRNDLRATDHPGLLAARQAGQVFGVYCFNPRDYAVGDYGFPRTGPFRARFLIETVIRLRADLEALGIPLFVAHQAPQLAIPELVTRYGLQTVFLQKEWTRDEQQEAEAVRQALPAAVGMVSHYGQFLFHPEDIPFKDSGSIPEVFTAFRKACEKQASVRPVLPRPEPQPYPDTLSEPGHIPTLEALGFSAVETDTRTAFPFPGGAGAAWDRLNAYFWEHRRLSFYKKTRNGLVGTEYSSKFSPWLANGSLSPREIYWEVKRYEQEIRKNQDTYWLVFELLWRDYFKYIALKHQDRIFYPGGIKDRHYPWGRSQDLLKAWTQGLTESDFVNANMRELARTGWMSNRGRQNAASYWTRTLGQDWRLGAAWFQYLLLDYDVHSNWGNWMYNSGVGNDPRDRTFNPELQARRYDADGRFRRLWLQTSLFENPATP